MLLVEHFHDLVIHELTILFSHGSCQEGHIVVLSLLGLSRQVMELSGLTMPQVHQSKQSMITFVNSSTPIVVLIF